MRKVTIRRGGWFGWNKVGWSEWKTVSFENIFSRRFIEFLPFFPFECARRERHRQRWMLRENLASERSKAKGRSIYRVIRWKSYRIVELSATENFRTVQTTPSWSLLIYLYRTSHKFFRTNFPDPVFYE